MQQPLVYDVDYAGGLDAFKRGALQAGRSTARHLERLGFSECAESRGESAYVWREDGQLRAHVNEGLGTKNLVADAALRAHGRSYYRSIAHDTVAMIVNDLATVGAAPSTIMQHLAVGSNDWFKTPNSPALVQGWLEACDLARVCWGGGETPKLRDMVPPDTAIVSGSATGVIRTEEQYLRGDRIQDGDAIVLVRSNGIHANGLTLARDLASELPDGYQTVMEDDRTYGEALLDPTVIYSPLVEDCFNAGMPLHYAVHISGHGWRKLMRATQPFRYVVRELPKPQPIFDFICKHARYEERTAYADLNMGAGFAIYVPHEHAQHVVRIAEHLGLGAWVGGHIKTADRSSVVLAEKDIVFHAEELDVR